uniref:Uncharacterized protein n=1 Tax=Knipowitschia caucasica TaxID=637954 RepID=A0AAV2JF39_KNICA
MQNQEMQTGASELEPSGQVAGLRGLGTLKEHKAGRGQGKARRGTHGSGLLSRISADHSGSHRKLQQQIRRRQTRAQGYSHAAVPLYRLRASSSAQRSAVCALDARHRETTVCVCTEQTERAPTQLHAF